MKQSESNWDCDEKISKIIASARKSFNDHLDMLYIQAMSKIMSDSKETDKRVTETMIEDFLKKRGYTLNYILKKPVMVKGFTCVSISKSHIEIWHDIPGRQGSFFVHGSMLTGLPITLNYMERI